MNSTSNRRATYHTRHVLVHTVPGGLTSSAAMLLLLGVWLPHCTVELFRSTNQDEATGFKIAIRAT
jgi:hypothetical protein